MVRKIFRVGHSVCVTLDKKMLQSVGLDGVSSVWIEVDKSKKKIVIGKRAPHHW